MAANVVQSAGGGAGSASGNEFEHSIGAFYLSGLLAGSASMPQFPLPDGAFVVKLHRQAYIEVDDIVLELNNGGGVFIQSKERIAAFAARDGDLRSCLEQFKRLTARMAAKTLAEWPRPLDWKTDRLIIAVSEYPQTLYRGISGLVKLARRQTDWAGFESTASQTEDGRQNLEICMTVLREVAPEITLTPEDQLALFQCMQMAPFDVLEASSHIRTEAGRLLGDHVVAQRASVQDAWRILVEYSASLAVAHGVATLDSTCKELSSAGVPLLGFPDFRQDFQILQKRSASEVDSLRAGLPCPGSSSTIEISRPALVAQILAALDQTRLVIVTGSPGCGKSTVLAQLYAQSPAGTVLLFRVDGLEARTLMQIETSFGLAYSIYEVIEQSRTTDNAVLIVDALDAAREPQQQEAVLAFVKAVLDKTNWKVILSMRLYVLRHSRTVQRSLQSYNYRPVDIPELDDTELTQVYQRIPILQQAAEQLRPSARSLVSNPFNLRLLAEILDVASGEAIPSFLPSVYTQVQLYQEYWTKVIGEGRGHGGVDRDKRIFTVLSAAKLMLEDNSMHVSKTRLVAFAAGQTCVDELAEDGVFSTVQSAEQLSLFHQTYHDFAIAKALQATSLEQIQTWLREPDRFLGLRIAMRYLLTLNLLDAADQFWDLWVTLAEARDIRYLLRSLPAEIVAGWPVAIADLTPLDRLFQNHPTVAAQCFEQVCKKMLVDPKPQTVAQAAIWLEWAGRYLPQLTDSTVWLSLSVMEMCLKQPAIDQALRHRISTLAQQVFDRYFPSRPDFAERATGFIAAVFPTEEQAEANILRTGVASHEPQICRRVVDRFEQIAQADPSLAADLAVMLVTYTETSTEPTRFSQSLIFSLTSNRSQDYNGVLWALRVKFPVLLERDFAEAFRVIEAEIGHKNSFWQLDSETQQAQLLSEHIGDYVLRHRVEYGAWRYDLERDNHESTVGEFRKWFTAKCSETTTDDVISNVMLHLYARNEHPIIWMICLQAAAAHPDRLGLHIAPLLSFWPIWSQDECRHAAWTALQAVFPVLPSVQRATIEQVLLALPERVPERWNECEIRTRDAAIAALPSEFMVTTAARDLRQQILARESPPPEIAEERFPEAHSRSIDPDEGLQISNEYRASNTYRHIRDGLDKLRAFEKEWLNGTPTRIACAEVFPVVNDLSAFLSQPQDPPVAPDQAEQVENLLREVAARFARCKEWQPDDPALAWTRSCLLTASRSPYPRHNPVADSQTSEFMSWSPAPHIAAAAGLPFLVANYNLWDDETQSTLEQLCHDQVDAVRLQAICRLHLFDRVAPEWAWQKVVESALNETHIGILVALADGPFHRWFYTRHEEVIQLGIAIVHREDLARRFSWQLPRALGGLIGTGCVLHASRTAQAEIDTWLSDIPTYAEFIKASLLSTDGYLVENATVEANADQSIRQRAVDLYLKAAQASLRLEHEYIAQNRAGEAIEATLARALLDVQDTLIMQLYFLGQRNLSAEEVQRGQRPVLSDEQRTQFLDGTAEVLQICSQFNDPSVNHHLIELCAEVIDLAPQLCVTVLWNIGRAEGDPRLIHFEGLALQEVIKAMNVLLADHLNLLKTSPELGNKLLDILDGFDEVGWPEAQRFILHLEDVLK